MPDRRKAGRKSAGRGKPGESRQQGRHTGLGAHGAAELPNVMLKSYNLEIKDEEDFIGDRASGRAFRALRW
jgi:hypothetical protein